MTLELTPEEMDQFTEEDWAEWAAENIMRIRTDPVWFFRTAYQMELDIWQEEAFEAMADVVRHHYNRKAGPDDPLYEIKYNTKDLRKFTIRAMHGPGKTFFAAAAIVWFHTAFKALSPATAPTIKQLKDRLWPRIRTVRAMANKWFASQYEVLTTNVIWNNDPDWKVTAETGATPENMQGYHDDFMLIVVDEASGVNEEMFPVIEGALSTGKIVLLLLIGNPTKIIGTFADSHLKQKVAKHYYQIHVDLSKTTRVSKQWVVEMGEKYGVTSPVYLVRCLGEFADEDENQLFSLAWLEEARNLEFVPDGSIPKQRLSVDAADGGGNFTVITHVVQYSSFIYFKSQTSHSFQQSTSTNDIVAEVKAQWAAKGMSKENGDDIVVDSLGVGTGVASNLISEQYPVIRYMGGAASDDSELWRCRRVQSYMVARDHFRQKKAILAPDFVNDDEWDDFDAQMCSIKRKPGIERNEDLLTKQEMVNKNIKSPDRADSVAMCFATQTPELFSFDGFQIIGAQMETSYNEASLQ